MTCRRPPRSINPEEGWVNRDGYQRIRRNGVTVLAHRWLWEQHNGAIPSGHEIHHVDGDKLHNALDNLEALSAADHRRVHGGARQLEDGSWEKECSGCKVVKPVDDTHYYIRDGWIYVRRCRDCHRTTMRDYQRRLRDEGAA